MANNLKEALLQMVDFSTDNIGITEESKKWIRDFLENQTDESLALMLKDKSARSTAIWADLVRRKATELDPTLTLLGSLGIIKPTEEKGIGDRVMTLPSGRKVVLKDVTYGALCELHEIKVEGVIAMRQRAGVLDTYGENGSFILCEPGIAAAQRHSQLRPLANSEIGEMFQMGGPPSIKDEEVRKRAVAKRHRQIHSNTGFSNSWLRRLNQELEKLGKDLTNRKLVKFIMDNCNLYPTWDDVVEGIKFYINADESCKEALRKYRKKAKKLGKTIKQ